MSDRKYCLEMAKSGIFAGIPLLRWGRYLSLFILVALLLALASCELGIPEKNRVLPFLPKSFDVPVDETPLHVLVLGDFGWGGRGQSAVATAIADVHRRRPFLFGITLGDNFYHRGVSSVTDTKWNERWEKPYGGLGLEFFPTLGNHDYYGDVQAQLDYRSPSGNWRFPARQYHFRAGIAEFVALDTMDPNPQQLTWLSQVVRTSQAPWLIVYGHHPVYSAGKHGDRKELVENLLPILRRAAMYLAGHDHDMQHLAPVDGTHFFVSGGGAKLRDPKPHPRTIFAKGIHGFTALTIYRSHVDVTMFGGSGEPIYTTKVLPPQGLLPVASETAGDSAMSKSAGEAVTAPSHSR